MIGPQEKKPFDTRQSKRVKEIPSFNLGRFYKDHPLLWLIKAIFNLTNHAVPLRGLIASLTFLTYISIKSNQTNFQGTVHEGPNLQNCTERQPYHGNLTSCIASPSLSCNDMNEMR